MFLDEITTIFRFLTDNDLLWVLKQHACKGTDAGRARADDKDSVIRSDFADSCSPEASCEYVTDKERLLVCYAVR